MKIKVKYLLAGAIAMVLLAVYVGFSSAADGPSAYLRYNGNVSISVYWDDPGDIYSASWANDILSDGSDLQWQALATSGTSGNTKWATLSSGNVTLYKNYFFKIANAGEANVTVVRAYPVDYNNGTNPDRPQNDYAHGNFTPDTSMCSACHITHTALKEELLRQATYYELCMLCHSSSNTQSKYDVETGHVLTAAGWQSSLAGPIKTAPGLATSGHSVDDTGTVNTTVYGSDSSKILTFTCVSCHNGHGGKNDNYRLLKKTIYPANNGWNPQNVSFRAFAIVKDQSVGEQVYFVSGNSEFCAACHLDYDEGNSAVAGGVYAADLGGSLGKARYRHPVTVGSTIYSVETDNYFPTSGDYLPLQYYSGASATDKRVSVVCETCHFAHGTTKSFDVSMPSEGTSITNQKMLRLDNYGVCESCHKK